ncbi:unnamed protein product [Danaus chrysippus]|uniref:(African queen) hypothetical protein n=1 Tax=Danaus chrysippus TaxID=151541 RepID=A0A8J2R1F0_9NEOP|nr:unnamed protein product [Danaus chrysippus]
MFYLLWCTHGDMGFSENIVILLIALCFKLPQTYTKPRSLTNNGKVNVCHTPKTYYTETDLKQSDKKSISNNELLRKTFHFRDIEYPVATTPRPQFYFHEYNDNQQWRRNFTRNRSSLTRNSNSQSIKNGAGTTNYEANGNKIQRSIAPKEVSNHDFLKAANFPEIEYPLSAKETWRPNYWQIDMNTNTLNKMRHDQENKFTRTGAHFNGHTSFPTRSYSDPVKNQQLLKQVKEHKAHENNTKTGNSRHYGDINIKRDEDNLHNITTDIGPTYTTPIPYYFTPLDCEDYINTAISSVQENNDQISTYLSTVYNQSLNNDFTPTKTDNQYNIDAHNFQINNHEQSDYNDRREPEKDTFVLEDDYTTDADLEDGSLIYSLASTASPYLGVIDSTWKNYETIEPDKCYIDDLSEYFISV